MQATDNIIEMRGITIDYKMKKYNIRAVTNVDLDLKKGKITALVGESGSGKTTLASSILHCISEPGVLTEGSIRYFDGESVLDTHLLKGKELNRFRWEKVSMVFQAAQSALNPVMNIFDQFYETAKVHNPSLNKAQIREKMRALLEFVNLDAERIMGNYPHELSGGMKQRVMIAFAILLSPGLIILDEPTTALAVITQDYIFKILKQINKEQGISMLLMTHDIGVVAKFSDYVGVMYAGRLMEYGTVREICKQSAHPYTRGLIAATPSLIADLSEMKPIGGLPPDLRNLPQGCVFSPRCPYCEDRCLCSEPETVNKNGHLVKCHRAEEWL